MRRLSLLNACLGFAGLVVGACGSDDDAQTLTPITQIGSLPEVVPSAPPTTAALSAAASTAPSTAAVARTQPSAMASTTPPQAASPPPPATSAPATPAPGTGTAVVYASSGDEYGWLPVGWWDGTAWGSVGWPAPDSQIPASTYGAVSVAGVDLSDGPRRNVTDFELSTYGCVDDAGLRSIVLPVDLPDLPEWYGYRLVGVTADWDVQPRPVRAVGLDAPEYQTLGESLVPTGQPVDPTLGDVTQALRADLDGDGIEEVFVTFESRTVPSTGAAGDFSVVIARLPRPDGAVDDEVLFAHVVPTPMDFPQPNSGRVVAIADVNGDGTMEVALGTMYWEGASIELFEFRDGSLHSVMASGCGV